MSFHWQFGCLTLANTAACSFSAVNNCIKAARLWSVSGAYGCMQVQRLEGWYKQRDNKMYPAWAYVLPTTILRLPYSLTAAVLWCSIVYYPVGLAPEPGR